MVKTKHDIRYCHAGDLSTKEARDLRWLVGNDDCRYQEIAVAGADVIGSWNYTVVARRGGVTLDSHQTEVQRLFKRRGIARQLWLRGVARWQPRKIETTIGTEDGLYFVADVAAELAHRHPQLMLHPTLTPDHRDLWQYARADAAIHKLRALGRAATASSGLQLVAGTK